MIEGEARFPGGTSLDPRIDHAKINSSAHPIISMEVLEMKAHKFCLVWIAFSMGIMAPGGMVLAAVKASEDRPPAVDKSLLLAIDEIRLAEPAKTKAESKAPSLPDNWQNAWGAIAKPIETPKDKPRSAVERAVLGHALLALNRNAESLHCFVSLENNVDQDAWLVWTKAFLDEKPNSTIALYFHIDALARSADDSKDGQTAVEGKIGEWYEAFKNKKSKDVSASEIMLMNHAGNLSGYSVAIYLFQTANYYAPWLADSHANLGWRHLQAAACEEADGEFEKALAITPKFPLAKLGLSFARRADKSKQQESLQLYQQALADVTVQAILKKENPQLLAQSKSAKGADTPGTGLQESFGAAARNMNSQQFSDWVADQNKEHGTAAVREALDTIKPSILQEARQWTDRSSEYREAVNTASAARDLNNTLERMASTANKMGPVGEGLGKGIGVVQNGLPFGKLSDAAQSKADDFRQSMTKSTDAVSNLNRAYSFLDNGNNAGFHGGPGSNNPAHDAAMKILQGDNANRLAPLSGSGGTGLGALGKNSMPNPMAKMAVDQTMASAVDRAMNRSNQPKFNFPKPGAPADGVTRSNKITPKPMTKMADNVAIAAHDPMRDLAGYMLANDRKFLPPRPDGSLMPIGPNSSRIDPPDPPDPPGPPGGGGGFGGKNTPGGAKLALEGMFQLMSKSPGFNGLMLKRAVQ